MKRILAQFNRRDAHWSIQFIKYGLCGGAATVVHVALVYTLSAWVIPALSADDVVVRFLGLPAASLSDALRARNYFINSCIAFVFSNLTAYILNVLWVFQPGRHARHVEMALFYAVSIVSMGVGVALAWGMIRFFGFSTTTSFVGNMVASLLINYLCRKYIIFKG